MDTALACWVCSVDDSAGRSLSALMETVRRSRIACRNVYAAYLLEVPRSMDLDVE